MVTSVVAPQSFRRTTPYISIDMFKTHRQSGVQVGNLVNGGDEADQDAALAAYIEEAAAWIDDKAEQSFAAMARTWAGWVNVNSRGYAVFHFPVQPVAGLLSLSIGVNPQLLSPLASLEGIMFGPDGSVQVPVFPLALTSSQGPIQFGSVAAPSTDAWCEGIYAGGYVTTTLTADVAAGATALPVAETACIVEGRTWLTVHAGRNRFSFLAGAVSTADAGGLGTGPGTVVCPATAQALVNTPWPIFVTSSPPSLIEANVLVVRGLIKQKGSGAVASQSAATRSTNQGRQNAGDDLTQAWEIIARLMNPVGDYQA